MMKDKDVGREGLMYRLSRYWNRIAYLFVHLGRRMIWDQTGRNSDLLGWDNISGDFASKYTEDIMCDRRKWSRPHCPYNIDSSFFIDKRGE
jgi:hypothetical protein